MSVERADQYSYGPAIDSHRMYLAMGHFTMASVLRSQGDWKEAGTEAVKSIEEWRLLIGNQKNHPSPAEMRQAETLLHECESH